MNVSNSSVMSKLSRRLRLILRRPDRSKEKGQGIVEYFAVLAFVSVLVAILFATSKGTLHSALSETMSSLVGQFDRLNSRAPEEPTK